MMAAKVMQCGARRWDRVEGSESYMGGDGGQRRQVMISVPMARGQCGMAVARACSCRMGRGSGIRGRALCYETMVSCGSREAVVDDVCS